MCKVIATLESYLKFWRSSPERIGGKTLKFYGRVNTWASESEHRLREDLIACKAYGLHGYHIELAGWDNNGVSVWTDNDAWKRMEKRYEWLVDQCRRLGLWLFVSVVNDNMGKGKYGDKGPTLSQVFAKSLTLVDLVRKHGDKNVLVQPVAEIQTSAGRKFNTYCVENLPGFRTVYNGSGGRPDTTGGLTYRAWHPSSISSVSGVSNGCNCFISSDHGNLIRELCYGLDGKMKQDQIGPFYNAVKSVNSPVCCFYAFLLRDHDEKGIKAFGKTK